MPSRTRGVKQQLRPSILNPLEFNKLYLFYRGGGTIITLRGVTYTIIRDTMSRSKDSRRFNILGTH